MKLSIGIDGVKNRIVEFRAEDVQNLAHFAAAVAMIVIGSRLGLWGFLLAALGALYLWWGVVQVIRCERARDGKAKP